MAEPVAVESEASEESSQSAKELGNKAFAAGDTAAAVDHWERGVRSCKYVLSKDVYEGAQKEAVQTLLKSLTSNLSLGHLKSKNFTNCIRCADEVLTTDPDNIKVLYRKAEALYHLDKFDDCLEALDTLRKLDPQSAAVRQLRVRAEQDRARNLVKEKKLMRSLFEKMEADNQVKQTPGLGSLFRRVVTSLLGWLKRLWQPVAGIFQNGSKPHSS